ncbi:hypothetical protein CRX72_23950 [Pantoea sp. BRM17]|nr:hypothetical protein CRX72_23950 [Pantoea sp. BRM17]
MLACARLALHKGKDMSEKIYGDRDLMAMDISGNHYCRHVDHMTRESLHSKSDIAAELGWRDMQIAALQQKLDAVLAENVVLKGFIDEDCYTLGEAWSSNGQVTDAAQSVPETPATDALLNAVRAEGVEVVRKHPAIGLCSLTHICDEISAQLRAETDTTSSQYESLAGGK